LQVFRDGDRDAQTPQTLRLTEAPELGKRGNIEPSPAIAVEPDIYKSWISAGGARLALFEVQDASLERLVVFSHDQSSSFEL
jgi:hypothetical protein